MDRWVVLWSVNRIVQRGRVGVCSEVKKQEWSKCHPMKKEVQLSFENITDTNADKCSSSTQENGRVIGSKATL
jgi:hypothetical protein